MADQEEIIFQGKKFYSYDQVLAYIAKITGRFDRDLNKQRLRLSYDAGWQATQKDYSTSGVSSHVSVHFKNLENSLVSLIEKADVVVGCVAWLTNERILQSLSHKLAVSIIVQKEDFLRPDSQDFSKNTLRRLYRKIPGLYRSNKGTVEAAVLETDQMLSDAVEVEGIRCLGFNRNTSRVEPNMHHKFVVFCKYEPGIGPDLFSGQYGFIEPYGVWTGSFNFTYNSTKSLENAVYIADEHLAQAYFSEWGQVAALSESLDWRTSYINPDFSIGSGT